MYHINKVYNKNICKKHSIIGLACLPGALGYVYTLAVMVCKCPSKYLWNTTQKQFYIIIINLITAKVQNKTESVPCISNLSILLAFFIICNIKLVDNFVVKKTLARINFEIYNPLTA